MGSLAKHFLGLTSQVTWSPDLLLHTWCLWMKQNTLTLWEENRHELQKIFSSFWFLIGLKNQEERHSWLIQIQWFVVWMKSITANVLPAAERPSWTFVKVDSDEGLMKTSCRSVRRFNHVNWGCIRTALHFLILLTLKIHKVEQETQCLFAMTDWGVCNDIHRGLEDYSLTYCYEFIIILMLSVFLGLQRSFTVNYERNCVFKHIWQKRRTPELQDYFPS